MTLDVVLKVEEVHAYLAHIKGRLQSMNGSAYITTNGPQPGIASIEVRGVPIALEM